MGELYAQKLHVTFHAGTSPGILEFPRCYTLTHSDRTGDLFLTIGAKYDQKQIAGLYTRLMRDEVLAELKIGVYPAPRGTEDLNTGAVPSVSSR